MTLIAFQDGKPILKADGTIGTEQACCCEEECSGPCEYDEDCSPGCECLDGECAEKQCALCPEDLYELCWSVTVTDFLGNAQTKTQDDFTDFPFFIPILDFDLPTTIGVSIRFDCVEGQGIFIEPGGIGREEDDCFGTADPALFLIPCTSEDGWWLGTTTGNAIVHNPVESPGCPQPVATFSVTISEPPC